MENVLEYKNQDAHDEIRSIIDELTKLGLSTYEAKIYTTLITFGPKPASELGFFSGVPRPKVYSTIRTLEKKGLVQTMPTKPVRFSASSPERNLFPAIEKMRSEVTKCEEALQTLSIKYEARKYINSREDYDVKRIVLYFASQPSSAGLVTLNYKATGKVIGSVNPVGEDSVSFEKVDDIPAGTKLVVVYANPDGVSTTGDAAILPKRYN